MTRYVYSLPWPPSAWRLYRNVKRTLLTPEHAAWRDLCRVRLLQQKTPPEPLRGPLAIDLALWRPNQRKFDVDNRVKPVLDMLTLAGVIVDDDWRTVQSVSVSLLHADQAPDGDGSVTVDIRPACALYRRGHPGPLFDSTDYHDCDYP